MKKRFTKEEMCLHLLLVHIYTNEVIAKLTSTSRILLEKITLPQLLQESPHFTEIEKSITVFIRTRNRNL
jgi:hypothetical protein